jgi:heterodisulfide reductase subunit A
MCILSPKLMDVARNPNITIHTCSEVQEVEGEVGKFRVTILKHPRYVDEELCNGCGDCVEVCPVEVYNRFDAGIGVRKAIYKPHALAVPDIVIKDQEHCIECGLCYDVCGLDAIRKEDFPKTVTVTAASIIVTTGYATFDPSVKEQFGYGVYPDVITSLELERMINAGGPTRGELRRISTGEAPKHVLFIQCVGSRDMPLNCRYCSCVCCMAAIKNALLIRERSPETEVTICYMDIRAYGKGYEEYYQRAERAGVRFVRGLPAEITEDRSGMTVRVENTEKSEMLTLHPDLVILSVGMAAPATTEELAARLGIPREETGFLKPVDDKINTVVTIRPGIYLAGTAVAPKDIPDSVAHGGSAAMRAYIDATRA